MVVPVYDEAGVLPTTLETLRRVLFSAGCEYELIFADDGSRMDRAVVLEGRQDEFTNREPQ